MLDNIKALFSKNRFTYGQKVKIVDGFFKNNSGEVRGVHGVYYLIRFNDTNSLFTNCEYVQRHLLQGE